MSKWIECNLPWRYNGSYNLPKQPNFDKKIKKLFGMTTQQAYKELPPYNTKGYKAATRKYKAFCEKVRAWIKDQPETIAYSEEIARLDKEYRDKSFCGQDLNKPRILLVVRIGEEIKEFLIGDINVYGGVCDDCMAFDDSVIVLRYKKIKVGT